MSPFSDWDRFVHTMTVPLVEFLDGVPRAPVLKVDVLTGSSRASISWCFQSKVSPHFLRSHLLISNVSSP